MPRGYQSYRGRRSAVIKLLIVVLVVILISACTFLFIQRFVTYTDDGTMRLDLPEFLQGFARETPEKPPAQGPDGQNSGDDGSGSEGGEQDVNLVIGPEDQEGMGEADPDGQAQTPAAETVRHYVQMDAMPADGSALADMLAASGANGFVWRARENTGMNRFASDSSLKDALAKDAVSAETLTALCGTEGVASVALFNCFHDSYYAYVNMQSAAVCQSNGFVWYDNLNYHWLDPAKGQARNYVAGLAVELAKLGFDELLLEDLAYPSAGKLYKISYAQNSMSKTDALALFLSDLRTLLEPYGVKLSLLAPEELLSTGSNKDSGQDLAVLVPLLDAVYARTADPVGAQALVDAAAGGSGRVDFVPLVDAPVEGDWCVPLA